MPNRPRPWLSLLDRMPEPDDSSPQPPRYRSAPDAWARTVATIRDPSCPLVSGAVGEDDGGGVGVVSGGAGVRTPAATLEVAGPAGAGVGAPAPCAQRAAATATAATDAVAPASERDRALRAAACPRVRSSYGSKGCDAVASRRRASPSRSCCSIVSVIAGPPACRGLPAVVVIPRRETGRGPGGRAPSRSGS